MINTPAAAVRTKVLKTWLHLSRSLETWVFNWLLKISSCVIAVIEVTMSDYLKYFLSSYNHLSLWFPHLESNKKDTECRHDMRPSVQRRRLRRRLQTRPNNVVCFPTIFVCDIWLSLNWIVGLVQQTFVWCWSKCESRVCVCVCVSLLVWSWNTKSWI